MKAQIAQVKQEFDVLSQQLIKLEVNLFYNIHGILCLPQSNGIAKTSNLDELILRLDGTKENYKNINLSANPVTQIIMHNNTPLVLNLDDWITVIGFKNKNVETHYLQSCLKLMDEKSTILEKMFAISVILPGLNIGSEKSLSLRLFADDKQNNQKEEEKGGKIYFITTECETYVKIGFTYGSVQKRIRSIQTGCPFRLVLLHSMICENPREKEQEYHKMLAKYRTSGEWFSVTGEVKQFLNKVMDYAQPKK